MLDQLVMGDCDHLQTMLFAGLRAHTDAPLCCCLQTIATELGSRFLADYLSGDTYFGTSRP